MLADVLKYIPQGKLEHFMDINGDITPEELADALVKCRASVGLGGDGVNIGLFKEWETTHTRDALLVLINRAYNSEKGVPPEWRDVILQRIYKNKGRKDECGSYRAISLISHVGKLVERVVQARLERLKEKYPCLVSDTQWSKVGCSCPDAILMSTAISDLAAKKGVTAHKCFADLTAAFDPATAAQLNEL